MDVDKAMIKHTAIYFSGKLLPAFISLFAISLYTRIVTPDQYGLFSIIIVTGGLLNTLFFQWLRSSLLRFYKKNYQPLYTTVISLMFAILLTLIPIMLIAMSFTVLPPSIFIYVYIYMTLTGLFELILVYFRARLNPNVVISASLIKSVVTFTITYLLISFNLGTEGLIFGAFLGLVSGIFCFCIFLYKNLSFKSIKYLEFDKKLSKSFLQYGLPITFSFALGVAMQNIDKFMVTFILGIESNGVYSVSFDLVHNIIYMVMTSISLAGFPIVLKVIKEKGEVAGRNQFHQYSSILLFVSIPVTLGLIGINEEFNEIFIGDKFTLNSALIILIALASLFHGLKSFYFDQALQISSQTKYFFVPALVALLFNIMLNYLLLPVYGVNGAAIATLVSFVISMSLSYFYSSKVYKFNIPHFVLGKITLASFLMLFFIQFINIENTFLTLIFKIVTGIFIYASFSLIFNTLDIRYQLKKFIGGTG